MGLFIEHIVVSSLVPERAPRYDVGGAHPGIILTHTRRPNCCASGCAQRLVGCSLGCPDLVRDVGFFDVMGFDDVLVVMKMMWFVAFMLPTVVA